MSVTWDVEPDSYPEAASSAGRIISHVLARVQPGSIILLHPWYGNRRVVLATVGPLIESLQREGYVVTTVGRLINYQRGTVLAAKRP